MGTGHGRHVAGAALLQRGAQCRVAAVDPGPRDPRRLVAGAKEPGDHAGGRLRFGREPGFLAQPGGPAAIGVGCPGARDV